MIKHGAVTLWQDFNHQKRKFILASLVVLVLVGLSVVVHIALINNAADDAYIHIRIAANLAKGEGPYFNPGERVFASSSTLWTVFLGLIFWILPVKPVIVAIFNGVFFAAACLVWAAVIDKTAPISRGRWQIFILQAFLVGCLMLPASIELMETPLAMCLLAICILLYLNESPFWYLVAGVLPFIRMEFVFFDVLLFLHAFTFRNRRDLIRKSWYVLLSALPFLIFDGYFYRTLIPNTVFAKSIVYQVDSLHTITQLVNHLISLPVMPVSRNLLGVALAVLILLDGLRQIRSGNGGKIDSTGSQFGWLIGVLYLTSLAICGFYVAGHSMHFEWYYPLYAVPLLAALISHLRMVPLAAGYALLFALVANPVMQAVFMLDSTIYSRNHPPLSAEAARVVQYKEVGQRLYALYPGEELLTSEIGGLGFGFKGKVMDGAGLVSPEALQYHPMQVPRERDSGTYGAIPIRYIIEQNPGLIVSYEIFLKEFLQDPIREDYVEVVVPALLKPDMSRYGGVFGCDKLYIFIRKDIYTGYD